MGGCGTPDLYGLVAVAGQDGDAKRGITCSIQPRSRLAGRPVCYEREMLSITNNAP